MANVRYFLNQRLPYQFLRLSFPKLTISKYWKINNGRHFECWVNGVDSFGKIICGSAIFRSEEKNYFTIGLFCVHPDYRRQQIGRDFFQFLLKTFQHLNWSAESPESIKFYNSLGFQSIGTRIINDIEHQTFRAP